MSGLHLKSANSTIVNHDEFHPVSQIPVHLPKMNNSCDDPEGCILESSTVTQAIYGTLDKMDVTDYASADELRTKLSSR